MAGINVPQYNIFKIGTRQLKNADWELFYTKQQAENDENIVALFEGQEFRLIKQIIGEDKFVFDDKEKYKDSFLNYIALIVIDNNSHFKRATNNKGIIINGNVFKRYVGTTGGLKNSTLVFVNADILDELNRRTDCGRKQDILIVPAKLEAYKALTCSASQPICDPNGICVVSDCMIHVGEEVITLSPNKDGEPIMEENVYKEWDNNACDGLSLCTPEYMQRVSESLGLSYVTDGVCLRNAWLKGMLYPFPIKEFIEQKNNGNSIVKDIWGNDQDLLKCEMIVTESSLKLWKAYDSINDYIKKYKENGYCFSVTKICPHKLDDQRELNYQYLQSYTFSDEDIIELCAPTVKYLKDALCGDYESTKKFLGLAGNGYTQSWQKALCANPIMMNEPYIIDSVYRMIKKKIDDAKIGKLIVNGNYQVCSGDPYVLMEHICGLPENGLLNKEECYSAYWKDKDNANELVIFRSPMTIHNNIRKCKNNINPETEYWYQYMHTIMVINCHDSFYQAENGADNDGDILYSTNNPVLLRNHKKLPAVLCAQNDTPKVIPTEVDILRTNKSAMGNKVGVITNRVTSMFGTLAKYEKDTKEYNELMYRIRCGQLYQQDEIDRIKGIVATGMPSYWYHFSSCHNKENEQYLKSICASRKPYFMIYIYDECKQKYNNYIKKCSHTAEEKFGKSLDDILQNPETEEENKFIEYYEHRMPFELSNCAMNRICFYIENEFRTIVKQLKHSENYRYTDLLYGTQISKDIENLIIEKSIKFSKEMKSLAMKGSGYLEDVHMSKEERVKRKELCVSNIKAEIEKAVPDDHIRMDSIWLLSHKDKCTQQFCWATVGDLIVKRVEELYGDSV